MLTQLYKYLLHLRQDLKRMVIFTCPYQALNLYQVETTLCIKCGQAVQPMVLLLLLLYQLKHLLRLTLLLRNLAVDLDTTVSRALPLSSKYPKVSRMLDT